MRWRRKSKVTAGRQPAPPSPKPIDANAIPFAEGRHLGTLYHRPPTDTWAGGDEFWPFRSATEVRGPVLVPDGMQVRLWASQKSGRPSRRIPANFEALRDLRSDDLDSLAVLDGEPRWSQGVAHLTDLSELIVDYGGSLSDEELSALAPLQRLVSLDVRGGEYTAEGLARLIDANPLLRFLHLHYSSVTDAVMPAVGRRPGLAVLKLSGTAVTDEGLRHLASLGRLELLTLEDTAISDRGLAALTDLSHLRELWLGETRVTDRGLVLLADRVGRLEVLRFGKSNVGDEGIRALKSCPALKTLILNDTAVTCETLDAEALQCIESLYLWGAPITEDGLDRIARLPRLSRLWVSGTPISDAGLARLNGHPTLTEIGLSFTEVSPGAILDLIESLPQLRRIHRGMETYHTPEQIAEFAADLRTAPPGAKTIDLDDLKPVAGAAATLEGAWSELGAVAGETPYGARTFNYDIDGRLWVGCFGPSRFGQNPASPPWLAAEWQPDSDGPVVLTSVGGVFTSGPDGRLWVGGHGLWSYHAGRWQEELKLRPGEYNGIVFDGVGDPWVIHTLGTLWHHTGDGWEAIDVPKKEQWVRLNAVAAHPDGGIWIASSGGLYRYRDGDWKNWQGADDGLPAEYWFDAWASAEMTPLNDVAVGVDGSVWASGGTGVVRYREGKFTLWDHSDGVWPWRRLVVCQGTGAVFGISGHQIGRFDSEGWSVTVVPEEFELRRNEGLSHAVVRNGALVVLAGSDLLLQFIPMS